ncbi:fructosamine kinase family protein [Micromonospora sp. LOL_021]|uniref:fructosamine kinase family protein n=1 Tax=Micromonospora sp. LOL_021 TaxID=3345417 RepID=UPI003A8857E0
MTEIDILTKRLAAAGLDAATLVPASGGVIAVGALVTLDDGQELFAKTLIGPDSDIFAIEAEGLRALREIGGAATPEVRHVTPNLLVLESLRPRPADDERFWEELGRMIVYMHTSTVHDRFGWHRDGWLGRMRQDNSWHDDGYAFFAECRVLRWLAEPLVQATFDSRERQALERLCATLPELIPVMPAVLTHGDLWSENVLATAQGVPVLIDPAVSYAWPEVDLAMLWCSPRPPAAERFFDAYAEAAPLADGWRDRMPLLHLRELMSIIAHDDDDWGAADYIRNLIAPFARR